MHPDRTQEAWATERFQRLSEAYQVLATPELRAAYDKRGNEVREGVQVGGVGVGGGFWVWGCGAAW